MSFFEKPGRNPSPVLSPFSWKQERRRKNVRRSRSFYTAWSIYTHRSRQDLTTHDVGARGVLRQREKTIVNALARFAQQKCFCVKAIFRKARKRPSRASWRILGRGEPKAGHAQMHVSFSGSQKKSMAIAWDEFWVEEKLHMNTFQIDFGSSARVRRIPEAKRGGRSVVFISPALPVLS